MPDSLDQLIAGRVPNYGANPEEFFDPRLEQMQQERQGRPSFIEPGMGYNPDLDVRNQIAQGSSLHEAQTLQGMRRQLAGQAHQEMQQAHEAFALPHLLAANPESPRFAEDLNEIFSKAPEAINSPRVQRILQLKQSLGHQKMMTPEDITDDPELAKSFENDPAYKSGDWRKARQNHAFREAGKQRRLDLIGSGMHPDEVQSLADKNGYIPDEAYTFHKGRLTNAKAPLSAKEEELLSKHQDAAEQEEDSQNEIIKSHLEDLGIKDVNKATPEQLAQAQRFATRKRSNMRDFIQSMSESGKQVPSYLLKRYGIQPVQTKWDPKGKKIVQQAPSAETAPVNQPNEQQINFLRANPNQAHHFEALFGPGSAAQFLK